MIRQSICSVEISMSIDDGSYVVQQVTETPGGRRVNRTLTEVESIPAGLRALALRIEQEALGEFGVQT